MVSVEYRQAIVEVLDILNHSENAIGKDITFPIFHLYFF